MSAFDHGELQLPLAKRMGNIGKYVREEATKSAREHKARLATFRAQVAEAKALVRQFPTERLAALGAPHGISAAQTRKQYLALAGSVPAVVIATLQREFAA